MADHNQIYETQAEKYHQLISKQPDLAPYVAEIRSYEGLVFKKWSPNPLPALTQHAQPG